MTRWLRACLCLLLLTAAPARADDGLTAPLAGLYGFDPATRPALLRQVLDLHDLRATGALIQLLHWLDEDERAPVAATLTALTGEHFTRWADWMDWQQLHPDLPAWPGYNALLAGLLQRLDPVQAAFLPEGVPHSIRLEEIVWGGVTSTGIPALDRPRVVPAGAAGYLADSDAVFGVALAGEARAYPLRIVNWHEMVNDVVGGVPISLAYCTLCGAGILFDTRTAGREPFTFGSSGLLYRSNKLMFDRQTHSLWNQFTGRPAAGPLTDSGVALAPLPLALLPWGAWRRLHPETTVLDTNTGFRRDYREGASYAAYFASPDLLFPAAVHDRAKQKQVAFGVRMPGGVKAWPLERFATGAVLNTQVGFTDVVVAGEGTLVRAFERTGHSFVSAGPGRLRDEAGQDWRVTEDALVAADGRSLARLPGHMAYRFAWEGYFEGAVEE